MFFEKALLGFFGRLLKMIFVEILYYNQRGERHSHIPLHAAHQEPRKMGFLKVTGTQIYIELSGRMPLSEICKFVQKNSL